MNLPTVVSRDEWLGARKDLLVKEKAATRARDALNTDDGHDKLPGDGHEAARWRT